MGGKYEINIGAGCVIGARSFGPGARASGSVTLSGRPASKGRLCEGSGQKPVPYRIAYFYDGKEVSQEESDRLYDEGIDTEPKAVEDPSSKKYGCPFCECYCGKSDEPMRPHMRDYSPVLR